MSPGPRSSKAFHPDGVMVLNKPEGPTSTACLNKIKSRFKLKKLGHAGTLDPMARGVLVALLGQATKLAPYITEGRKTYWGVIRLGVSTDTYDMQGTVLEEKDCSEVSPETIEREIKSWEDLKEQPVPAVSAAKHQGKPFYALARAGQEVPCKTKEIDIYQAQVLNIEPPLVEFRITCSAGTYVRSLAHSLGMRVGCCAALAELVREKSHPFSLDQAVDLDTLMEARDLNEHLLPIPRAMSHWEHVRLDPEQEAFVRNGRPIEARNAPRTVDGQHPRALLLSMDGSSLALAEARKTDGRLMWSIIRGLWT
ncbi:tRNA pseudouridine synthase B [Desulfonatronospira thiodismutans ASO3-1]|uniref:tRNA pseudouridine synthase B n=1 Tax=Desulfonatronospira thiodismutans ASO3-1 TaxID=555779 RepID=D6SK71_9BACT|nr:MULTISPECIES: tRNA pseudouridine(55) synthase TruB [Desulfonatronospira]EFI36274.1 tRNA pseudouridine synthase B [Desulfonatronospira thiodismutans ASO3-1]RQD75852.1 MAG: tRNA pseudouridine(55) synthase TruB [Desulfonatronospira sp. MSAO_Bac3]